MSDQYLILDKLLSGQYNPIYIIFGIVVLTGLYRFQKNRQYYIDEIKNFFNRVWIKEYGPHFLKKINAFTSLEQSLSVALTTTTGDYVKDMLLKDISQLIADVTQEQVKKYVLNIDFRHVSLTDIHYNCSLLMKNIFFEIKEGLNKTIPPKVIMKLNIIFQDLEHISFVELSEYTIDDESTVELLRHHIKHICLSYARMIKKVCSVFHTINGDLNGILYNDYIVGVYDSSKVFKGSFPLPNSESEKDADLVSMKINAEINCDVIAFFTFHDSNLNMTNSEEIGNRIISMTYCWDQQIEKNFFQRIKLLNVLDSFRIPYLIENKAIFTEREKEEDWSRLKSFMSGNNIEKIIIQPVLRNKLELMGLLVLGWKKNEMTKKFEEISENLHPLAARCSRFFSYQDN